MLRAVVAAAAHAGTKHGPEGMYAKLDIVSVQQLRDHVVRSIWNQSTERFTASNDRDICHGQTTNTRIILNSNDAGTCLITRAGEREFRQQYRDELERHDSVRDDSEFPVVRGGIQALHPKAGSVQPNLDRDNHNGEVSG